MFFQNYFKKFIVFDSGFLMNRNTDTCQMIITFTYKELSRHIIRIWTEDVIRKKLPQNCLHQKNWTRKIGFMCLMACEISYSMMYYWLKCLDLRLH